MGPPRNRNFSRTVVRTPLLPPGHSTVGVSDRGDLRMLLLHPGDDFSRRDPELAYPFPDRTVCENKGGLNDNADRLCSASTFEKPSFAAARHRSEYFLVLALLQIPFAARRNGVTYDYWNLGTFYSGGPGGITGDSPWGWRSEGHSL